MSKPGRKRTPKRAPLTIEQGIGAIRFGEGLKSMDRGEFDQIQFAYGDFAITVIRDESFADSAPVGVPVFTRAEFAALGANQFAIQKAYDLKFATIVDERSGR